MFGIGLDVYGSGLICVTKLSQIEARWTGYNETRQRGKVARQHSGETFHSEDCRSEQKQEAVGLTQLPGLSNPSAILENRDCVQQSFLFRDHFIKLHR